MSGSKVFLGGTCNESTWRNDMISLLTNLGIEYFNPVVDDWNEEAQKNELRERAECDICLYTITPKMAGVYSIAEVIDDSNKRPEKTIMVLLKESDDEIFNTGQWKSLLAVAEMIEVNRGAVFYDLYSAAEYIATL